MLTPLVCSAATVAGARPRPFLFACVFAANTSSALLPVSNPANFLLAATFHVGFGEWARDLGPATVAGAGANLVLFLVLFRGSLGGGVDTGALLEPATAIRHAGYFRACLVMVGLTFAAFFAGPWYGISAGTTAAGGAGALLLLGLALRVVTPWEGMAEVPWGLLLFTSGLFVQVAAIERLPLTGTLAGLLASGSRSPFSAARAGAAAGAAGSNLINNLPMSLLGVTLVRHASLLPVLRRSLAYGLALGCDLGPNLMIVGSLATMLWLTSCRKQGESISASEYFNVGALVTPLTLGVALGVLAIQWTWHVP